MSPSTSVLVVEDEDSFIDALTLGLTREGFTVSVARDGAEALDMFDDVQPDLVLLDVMLPKVSGLDVCRELRSRSGVPIIMVTAKGAEIDTVVGLEVGADDYVTKPYRLRELVARIRAVLRRRGVADAGAALPGVPSDDVLRAGDVIVDHDRHEVFVRGDPEAIRIIPSGRMEGDLYGLRGRALVRHHDIGEDEPRQFGAGAPELVAHGADRLRRVRTGEREKINDVAAARIDGARLEATAIHGLHVCQQQRIRKLLPESRHHVRDALVLEQRRPHFDDADPARQRRSRNRATLLQGGHVD